MARETVLLDDHNKPIGIRLNKSRQRNVIITATDITATKTNWLLSSNNRVKYFRDMTWRRYVCFVLGLHLVAAPLAWGGEWRITPRLEVRQTVTDNVTLAPQGQEESDAVTEINPIISMRGTGRRLNLNLNYRLQSLFYAQDSDRNDVRHQLGATANVELVKERFFIEAAASVRQANIFNTGRVARDNVTVTGNRSDVASASIEPIWRERWGGYADTELRYRTQAFRADTDNIADSNFDEVNLTAQNGRRSTQLTWNIDAQYRNEERLDRDDDFEDYRAEGQARWPANRENSRMVISGVWAPAGARAVLLPSRAVRETTTNL